MMQNVLTICATASKLQRLIPSATEKKSKIYMGLLQIGWEKKSAVFAPEKKVFAPASI
jgi:hypothetical protein